MIQSMTGYGRSETVFGGKTVSVEIKSVNHRFFDLTCRLPRGYAFLEAPLRAEIGKTVRRGKVEVSVSVAETGGGGKIKTDISAIGEYIAALRDAGKKYSLPDDLSLSSLAGIESFFSIEQPVADDDTITGEVFEVLNGALDTYTAMRIAEGVKLREDIAERLRIISEKVDGVEKKSPRTVEAYRARLEKRIRELLAPSDIDERMILNEAAIFADKIDINEETVRLRSHMKQFRVLLDSDGPAGKKMDFLTQEMNREANTIASKAQDADIIHTVVDIKSEIEKIREQVQNIE